MYRMWRFFASAGVMVDWCSSFDEMECALHKVGSRVPVGELSNLEILHRLHNLVSGIYLSIIQASKGAFAILASSSSIFNFLPT